MPVIFKEHKDFISSLNNLWRLGGQSQKIADKVYAILSKIKYGDDNALRELHETHHGENRIEHCVKYDIGDGHRLVTIQDRNILLFCFAGAHNLTERWLERNKGLTIIKNKDELDTCVDPTTAPDEFRPILDGKLISQLDKPHQDDLKEIIKNGTILALIKNFDFTTPDSLIDGTSNLLDDKAIAKKISKILLSIKIGNNANASKIIDLHLKRIQDIASIKESEIIEIDDGGTIIGLPIGSAEYENRIKKLIESPYYQDWMLFMHPKQRKIINKDYKGAALLSGVSGSGKTCIVIHRAIRLAKETNKPILVLTLNESLAKVINDLLDHACIAFESVKGLIECKSFFKLCQELLRKFEPEYPKHYDFITWKTNEHIDSVWREFYRQEFNNDDAKILFGLHKSLLSQGINAESYIRDEFDWARSVILETPNYYLDTKICKRSSRTIPFSPSNRKIILDGIEYWKEKMRKVGVSDYLNISSALHQHINKISPIFHHVLVDEAQDFGTIELNIIRALTHEGQNNLFFAGDVAQTVLAKSQNFKDAHINLPQKKENILRNYRNSKEILSAAFDIFYGSIEGCDSLLNSDFEILDPKYANFHTSCPQLLSCDNFEDEIKYALSYAKNGTNEHDKICICFAGYKLIELKEFSEKYSLALLDGHNKFSDHKIFVSDFEQMKGLEFDHVLILNCNKNTIPDPYLPEEESFRDLCRLYVAMTRAKQYLFISYCEECSHIFKPAITKGTMQTGYWDQVAEIDLIYNSILAPKHLPQFFASEIKSTDVTKLTGIEFLYTDYALNFPDNVLNKLEEVVDGKGKIDNYRTNAPSRWKTIGEAYIDAQNRPQDIDIFKGKINKLREDFLSSFKKYMLASFIREKNIQYLIHFTRSANIHSIKEHGILSINQLNRTSIPYFRNSNHDISDRDDWISTSVEFPDYELLEKFEANFNDEFVIILIDAQIITSKICLFYQHNLSDRLIQHPENLKIQTYGAFTRLFENITPALSRKTLGIPQNYTTDPRSEILIKDKIGPSYIIDFIFKKDSPDLFKKRLDWEYWKGKQ
ncbi:MAG: DarT ssDNA thymidine ADP-ribosyltransferase family protein [Desulfovibrio sp.]|nr:DarT ssDNA thymidine ADP-ribosyltransferase family protein [Desulfovibrio sp.]